MLSIYPACFFYNENGYSVIFPDLNWLATCGDTLEEAMNMAIDCLAGYLYESLKSNESIPYPSKIGDIDIQAIAEELGDINYKEAFLNMISVDVKAYAKEHFEKSVKKNCTIPAWLNKAALEQGLNFSQILQEALIAKLNNQTFN